MKTIEEVIGAMKFRIGKIEESLETLSETMDEDDGARDTYISQYQRHHELVSLLKFIEGNNEQTGCGAAQGQQGACGTCPSACGNKS